jgi:hypothetical protein
LVGIVWQNWNSLWWRVAMSFLVGMVSCPPANAQTLFEALFGFGSLKHKAEKAQRPRVRAKQQSYRDWSAEHSQSSPADRDDYRRDPAYGGNFKTVCVRTCDGYYWPVSRSVTSERFATDERRCDAACLGDAKLYYQHKDSDDPKTLIALDGSPYTGLKTAFFYRKSLLNGCGCRPAPWSTAEAVRHQAYRVAEDARKLQIAMEAERVRSEQLRQDKIAQIIAATREAVLLDEAEEATFGEAVAVVTVEEIAPATPVEIVAAVDAEPDADASITGYVHLHVLPNYVVEAELVEGQAAEPAPTSVAELEAAFAEIAAPLASDKATAAFVRKTRGRAARTKASKPVKTVSLFGDTSSFVWPGDGSAR